MIKTAIKEHLDTINLLLDDQEKNIHNFSELSWNTIKNNGKIVFCGNGGSAADSQHLAAELVSRYKIDRPPLASIALTVDTSALTAIGNDYGYNQVFSRQVAAICNKQDLLVGISTSGNSENIISAVQIAKEIGCETFGLLGNAGGKLIDEVDNSIVVPSNTTARIQEAHILIGHIMCEYVEQEFIKTMS